MPSTCGWVDFAEEDRRRMLDAVHLFDESGTVDELGIGSIRDAFADFFFPGTSTIQTRARYFLFIPWIYQILEGRSIASGDFGRRARRLEVQLIQGLLSGDPDASGIIGKEAKDKLKRMPSNVYWSGLAAWGIRKFPGSQSEYHRSVDGFYIRKKRDLRSEEDEFVPDLLEYNWDPHLPLRPTQFPADMSMALNQEEAEYLRGKVRNTHPASLLSHFLESGDFTDSDFLWENPILDNLSTELQEVIAHAQNFTDIHHTAALLYNLMMAKKRNHVDWIATYENRLAKQVTNMRDRWQLLIDWQSDRDAFWSNSAFSSDRVRLSGHTRRFVEDWLDLLFRKAPELIASDSGAQNLIRDREAALKGPARARLENKRALERWSGASGDSKLTYRWGQASTLIHDIRNGLFEKE